MPKVQHHHAIVICLLIIFLTRIIAIDHFPVFVDETIHIHTAERMNTESPLINSGIGRVLSIWWLWLFQPAQSGNPIWLARVATLIVILPGMTALLHLAYRVDGYHALLLMALFLLFSPYHFFFERLALADPIAASFILVAIAAGYRLRDRFNYLDALLCGGFLAFGLLAKLNVLPYAGIVVAAAVGFGHRHSIVKLAKWLTVALGPMLIPVIAFETLIRITENAWLGAIFRYVTARTGNSVPLLERISGNAGETLIWFTGYMHPVMVIILFIGVIVAIFRRRWYLLLVLIAPIFPMLLTEPQETRYWLIPIGLIGLLTAVGISEFLQKYDWKIQSIPVIGLVFWGMLLWLPQAWSTANNPVSINLPHTDMRQYVYSDATGFGFEQIPDFIPDDNRPQIIGLLANCQGLRFTYWTEYEVLCRAVNPNGQDIPALIQWVEDSRGTVDYVILEVNGYMPDSIDGDIIGTIERPANLANLTIYTIGD